MGITSLPEGSDVCDNHVVDEDIAYSQQISHDGNGSVIVEQLNGPDTNTFRWQAAQVSGLHSL